MRVVVASRSQGRPFDCRPRCQRPPPLRPRKPLLRRRILIVTGHIGLGWSGRATGLAAHRAIVRSHFGHVVIALALATRVVAATLQFRFMTLC
jgi:hypothetical protein